MIKCPRCGSQNATKNGLRSGRQCHMCKNCGYQFTTEQRRVRPVADKLLAVLLRKLGVPVEEVAEMFDISTASVFRWSTLAPDRMYSGPILRTGAVRVDISELMPALEKVAVPDDDGQTVVVLVDGSDRDRVVGVILQKPEAPARDAADDAGDRGEEPGD
ncbi:MAG: hypothetical protein Q4F72_05490 [Desulfovibrionaceae bacterium]|nr:hypothetical protein [Desulfovibrionaceae bacterium]